MLYLVLTIWSCSIAVFSGRISAFDFPDEEPNFGECDKKIFWVYAIRLFDFLDFNGLERQALPVFPPALTGSNIPVLPPTAPATAAAASASVPLPTPTNGQTCVCVPTGTCSGTLIPPGNTDGSGLLDIRIVTNVSNLW